MTDPRETKLPKWAQDLIAEERMKYLVRFPDRPCPEPDIMEYTGHSRDAPRHTWIYSENSYRVFAHWVGKNGYLFADEREGGSGAQVRGHYYLNKEDAELAHLWRVCRECALRILKARGQS
jgi:hypothetical protein